jgi:hypothetical protein
LSGGLPTVLFVRLALGSDEKVPSSSETKPPWAVALPVLNATESFQAPADAGDETTA